MGMSKSKEDRREQPKHGPPKADARIAKPIIKGGKEIRGIVRIAGRDLLGGYPLKRALGRVKGVGMRLANIVGDAAFRELKLPHDTLIGELEEAQIEQLERILSAPDRYGVPKWMLNRQRELETGEDRHMIGTDLTFSVKQDIEREKNIGTWIGYRHNYGQKVRGQHTRTTGRSGMTVGVVRKTILAKAAGAAAAAAAPGAAAKPAAPAKKEEKK